MTPVQYWIYIAMGVSEDVAIKVAFGTTLFVILPTAMSSTLGHSRKGAVIWRAALVLSIAGAAGSLIGATVATHLPGGVLRIIFGLAILAGGIRMLTAKPPKIEEEPVDNPLLLAVYGFPLGIVIGVTGIGGGVLMIPLMVLLLKFRMHQAVGTSSALMIATSTGGVIGYIINGLGVEGLFAYSLGYVNLISWLALAVTSVPMAQVGVRVSHRLPARELKYIFVAVMIGVGLKMIGVSG